MIPSCTNKECNSQTLSETNWVIRYNTEILRLLFIQNIRTLVMKNHCLAYD